MRRVTNASGEGRSLFAAGFKACISSPESRCRPDCGRRCRARSRAGRGRRWCGCTRGSAAPRAIVVRPGHDGAVICACGRCASRSARRARRSPAPASRPHRRIWRSCSSSEAPMALPSRPPAAAPTAAPAIRLPVPLPPRTAPSAPPATAPATAPAFWFGCVGIVGAAGDRHGGDSATAHRSSGGTHGTPDPSDYGRPARPQAAR